MNSDGSGGQAVGGAGAAPDPQQLAMLLRLATGGTGGGGGPGGAASIPPGAGPIPGGPNAAVLAQLMGTGGTSAPGHAPINPTTSTASSIAEDQILQRASALRAEVMMRNNPNGNDVASGNSNSNGNLTTNGNNKYNTASDTTTTVNSTAAAAAANPSLPSSVGVASQNLILQQQEQQLQAALAALQQKQQLTANGKDSIKTANGATNGMDGSSLSTANDASSANGFGQNNAALEELKRQMELKRLDEMERARRARIVALTGLGGTNALAGLGDTAGGGVVGSNVTSKDDGVVTKQTNTSKSTVVRVPKPPSKVLKATTSTPATGGVRKKKLIPTKGGKTVVKTKIKKKTSGKHGSTNPGLSKAIGRGGAPAKLKRPKSSGTNVSNTSRKRSATTNGIASVSDKRKKVWSQLLAHRPRSKDPRSLSTWLNEVLKVSNLELPEEKLSISSKLRKFAIKEFKSGKKGDAEESKVQPPKTGADTQQPKTESKEKTKTDVHDTESTTTSTKKEINDVDVAAKDDVPSKATEPSKSAEKDVQPTDSKSKTIETKKQDNGGSKEILTENSSKEEKAAVSKTKDDNDDEDEEDDDGFATSSFADWKKSKKSKGLKKATSLRK